MCSRKPKFDLILNNDVDTQRIDLKKIECWLKVYFKNFKISYLNDNKISNKQSKIIPDLITDLILDFLRSERYPDAQVLQCSLNDLGVLSLSEGKKLMKHLWDTLLDEQASPSSKKTKLMKDSTNSTFSKVYNNNGFSSRRECFDFDHKKIYSGTRDARKSVNTK